MSKLVFGCGYLGHRVARLWRDAGETVHVVTRSANRAAQLQDEGYASSVADVTRPESLIDLPAADTVLFAVGFDRTAGGTIHDVYADGLRNVLAALPATLERIVYISTTGVYGSAGGAWVDESTPPNPTRDGGKASLAAEQLLGENAVILRLAGIYGPNRVPYLAKLRAGEPIAAPSAGWLNLIHVDDGAAIVLAAEAWSMTQGPRAAGAEPELFCVSDGQPVIRGDYYREVARLIDADPPQFVAPEPNSPPAARANSDKRIANTRLRQALQRSFTYPSYREGLAAIL